MPPGLGHPEPRLEVKPPRSPVRQHPDQLGDQPLGSHADGGHWERPGLRQPLPGEGGEAHRSARLRPGARSLERQHRVALRLDNRARQGTGQFLPQKRQGLGSGQGQVHRHKSLPKKETAVAWGFPGDGGAGSEEPEPL